MLVGARACTLKCAYDINTENAALGNIRKEKKKLPNQVLYGIYLDYLTKQIFMNKPSPSQKQHRERADNNDVNPATNQKKTTPRLSLRLPLISLLNSLKHLPTS
jgi:hypothetical protein